VVVTCIIALATVLVPGTVFGSFDDKGYRFLARPTRRWADG